MTNRGKSSTKTQNDDDNCSVICYKDPHDGHVGVVRIRQQPVCSACNLLRGTLSTYYKHIVDQTHRENVKKLCDENRFVPSVYDQAIHLAFHNNFYYQSEKFHFLYKHTKEESSENEKMDVTSPQRKRRNFEVTLVFQEKTYSQIGLANAQIREQLLKDMIADRADDLAALPMDIYYTKKKIMPEDIHHNAPKGTDMITANEDQTQVMLKKQQQGSFDNDQMSSAENHSEDNGVEQNIAMTTHEMSITDDTVCQNVLDDLLCDVYSKSEEFKREERFLSGLARRNFRKRNTFYCDLCDTLLPAEKHCSSHLNSSEHLEKTSRYQTECLPWRQAMQKALITGQPLKEIMDKDTYDNYKSTMALYLAPDSLGNRGRFCCAYCEVILTTQWALEKHLHSTEHKNKQTPADHKELIVRFANSINFSIIFKFNGITQISEVPDDIRTRYRWRVVTLAELNDNINSFIRNYPFDTFEGATRILTGRAARKQKSLPAKTTVQNTRNTNQQRGGHFQTTAAHRGTGNKRPFSATNTPSKRFRADLNNSYPSANRGPGLMRNYNMEQHNYNRPMPYNNGNNQWSNRYSNDQQRREFFERSNFELRSIATDNNGYFGDRTSYPMPEGNNYNQNRQAPFNGQSGRDYRSDQRANTGPINERIHPVHNNLPYPQRTSVPLMGPMHHQNPNSFGAFGVNNSNSSPFFSSPINQQPSPMRAKNPPIHSYADYRSTSALPNNNYNNNNTPNPVAPQARRFDEFSLAPLAHNSSNAYPRSGGPPFRNGEAHYGNFGQQNQTEPTSWRGSSRGGSYLRGRGGRGTANSFQSNKQPGATFSYSSNSNNNKGFSHRARGVTGRNARNFGSGR